MTEESTQPTTLDVDTILAAKQSQYKTTEVHKEIDIETDIGNLLATDNNVLEVDKLKKDPDDYLMQIARDNVQILINEVWKLPTKKKEDVVLAELPAPTTTLPREKPIPKPKAPTKWELFAKEKGIKKKKRSRMVFDEKAQEWKPRYGYKRVNDPKDDWVLEVPQNADQYDDQFEKKSKEREERIAKNEYQRLRNLARDRKGKGKVPIPPSSQSWNKEQLTKALSIAKSSTASAGKFTSSLPSEPVPKNTGKKRQYLPVTGSSKDEKQ
ncbi:ribosome biogenesis regulatory protein homolog [Dysidea avara]|uniref:ribosome biogenesis regulatory protein homolog n=1 Tax=Dysidea avara TaxID=196820 RepID=UPI00332129C9